MHINRCIVPARTQLETDRTPKPPAPPPLPPQDPQRIAAAYTLIIAITRYPQGHHRQLYRQDEDDRLRRTDSERPTAERVQPPDIPIVESAR